MKVVEWLFDLLNRAVGRDQDAFDFGVLLFEANEFKHVMRRVASHVL